MLAGTAVAVAWVVVVVVWVDEDEEGPGPTPPRVRVVLAVRPGDEKSVDRGIDPESLGELNGESACELSESYDPAPSP